MGALVTGQMLSLLLSFGLPLILVRVLSKNDYGLYAQFNVILTFFVSFFSFGFGSDLYFLYPSAGKSERRILIFQSLMLLLFSGIVACFALLIPVVKDYFVTDVILNANYLYLQLGVLFSIPEVIMTTLYVLNHDNKLSALFLPVTTFLRVFMILLFYWISPEMSSVFIALFLGIFFKFLCILLYAIRLIRQNDGVKLYDYCTLKKQLRYTLPLGVASSTRIFIQQIDKLIIFAFVDPVAYAIYSIAFYGVPGLSQVYLSISHVYVPRMSMAASQHDDEQIVALYHSMVSKTLSYTVPIVFIIFLFSDPIIPFVFSSKYLDSVPYFRFYLLTFIVSCIGCGNILRATGYTKKSFKAYLYTAIFILPFTYFAIKYFYLNGAITAAVVGQIFPKILLSYYDAKVLKLSFWKLYPWRSINKLFAISAICLIPFLVIYLLGGHDNFFLSLLWIALYLTLTFALQMYFNAFIISWDECRGYIDRIFRWIKSR